jgi:hypothetical protein
VAGRAPVDLAQEFGLSEQFIRSRAKQADDGRKHVVGEGEA